jgi:hypothetical protein
VKARTGTSSMDLDLIKGIVTPCGMWSMFFMISLYNFTMDRSGSCPYIKLYSKHPHSIHGRGIYMFDALDVGYDFLHRLYHPGFCLLRACSRVSQHNIGCRDFYLRIFFTGDEINTEYAEKQEGKYQQMLSFDLMNAFAIFPEIPCSIAV